MATVPADRWRALSPYLDEVLDIPKEERTAWFASLQARDATLAADLRTLLAEQDVVEESHFLERDVVARPRPTPSLAGQVLGAYRLVSPIGQGGMGSVWLAERCDGRFEGRAAVKLLNFALMGRTGEERFRREGTILARVTHDHIAHLIDAGISPAGQPYLVLEHVDGQSIDRYCDEHALGIEARLRLFLDVLEAVAHAHANLIVHRDIKPANVLVSVDGRVKLLDFGIAKLLECDGSDATSVPSGQLRRHGAPPCPPSETSALTREGGAALTPEYAAPEQLAGGPVTTATDVYALGVLLYVLLSGRHPAGDASHSAAALIRAIVDTVPVRVSDAIRAEMNTPDGAERHAAQYGTTSSRLRRQLRGDLDTIVAKALKKNPDDRYASVTAMADDLRRFLHHEPISARPDTLSYRAARFVRRHAGGVATAAALVVAIVVATAFHTSRLSTERDRAQREAEKATKVSELVIGLLTSADPYAVRTTRTEPTVRGLLDSGAEQVQKELIGQPELQAQILTAIGRTYRRLGVFDKAQPLLEQALASARTAYGQQDIRVAQALHDLGSVFLDKGDYASAVRSMEQALEMRRKLLGPEHADVAVTLVELGRAYQDEGLNQRAEPLQGEALRIRRKVFGDVHRETAVSLADLASVLRLNGDLAGAESFLNQSLDVNRKTRGDDHPNTATTRHDLALIATAKGNLAAAEAELRQVLATHRKTLGDTHPVVATTLNSLSHVLAKQARYDEAVAALKDALAIAGPALGTNHQLYAIYSINLASVYVAQKQFALAAPLLREALRVRMQAPGVVPNRRRTLLEDDWSVDAIQRLLAAASK
jgi:eukaryotic-like serine/threonine-protein kinase